MAVKGLIRWASSHGPKETMDRLAVAVAAHGLTIFARLDHAAAAAEVGMTLRTEVLIFGSPKAGTPLMQISQAAGLDLPLKALVWQDEQAKTWLGYFDPASLARRYGVEAAAITEAMRAGLAMVAKAATGAEQPE